MADTAAAVGGCDTVARATEALRRSFPGLGAGQIVALAHRAREVVVEAGRVLVAEGRPADATYFVNGGTATVSHGGRHLATLGAGACVGANLEDPQVPRFASVVAASRLELLMIAVDPPMPPRIG